MPTEKPSGLQSTEHKEDESQRSEKTFKVPHTSSQENEDVHRKIQHARSTVKEKEEVVRKLRLVKMYRTKWETQDLDTITNQWLRVCQEALEDLRVKVRDMGRVETGKEELTLQALISNLGLDAQLLQLNESEDSF